VFGQRVKLLVGVIVRVGTWNNVVISVIMELSCMFCNFSLSFEHFILLRGVIFGAVVVLWLAPHIVKVMNRLSIKVGDDGL
jgi:hypothetical protein